MRDREARLHEFSDETAGVGVTAEGFAGEVDEGGLAAVSMQIGGESTRERLLCFLVYACESIVFMGRSGCVGTYENTSDIAITVGAISEPTGVVLLGLGSVICALRRRRGA